MVIFFYRRLSWLLKILITSLSLLGCGQTTHYAPVADAPAAPSEKVNHHIVAKGETLYSIAWRYDLDFRKLSKANGLPHDFRIYPGQRLVLTESVTEPESPPLPSPKLVIRTPEPPRPVLTRSKKETPKVINTAKKKNLTKPVAWSWPARGSLSEGFAGGQGLHKGIDIQGRLEEPILAAASGNVVYSGEGLRGYGKLVIVKHSEKYLSAYAHNHKILVEEGAYVKQGQKIALMGSTGTDRVKLHFEIRFDGKPVDPLSFLPKR